MSRSVAQKMGAKEGSRALLVNAPASAVEAIELPNPEIAEELVGEFDHIHLFTITQAEILWVESGPTMR